MAVRLEICESTIRIVASEGEIPPSTKSTLGLKGFRNKEGVLEIDSSRVRDLALFSLGVLERSGMTVDVDEKVKKFIDQHAQGLAQVERNLHSGRDIKQNKLNSSDCREFLDFLQWGVARALLPHQVKAAIHMVSLDHSANFSVPGAGKTSVVLSVYEYLRIKGELSSLFVVGPRSCFGPWESEFTQTLGRQPKKEVLAGGDVEARRLKYFPQHGQQAELYLVTYHTLARDQNFASSLLRAAGNRVFFVIDEAHYMKQDEGVWANAILRLASFARKRCVLTGTPFPKDYADGINQFEALYPGGVLFDDRKKAYIRDASVSGQHAIARTELEPRIDGLYYRVRKSELGLTEPVFLPAISVTMNPLERELYDCIEKRVGELANLGIDDFETVERLKRGRNMRLRQATSYAALLSSAIDNYHEELIDPGDLRLRDIIRDYDELETPAKVQKVIPEIDDLLRQGEKVVVWANFVGVLHKIQSECERSGMHSQVVFGGTPTEDGMDDDSRETIIEKFKGPSSGLDILIANPAACAESVSLHKTCSNAIYYDLSYNCAQYLQSLDRIHRVGGSEESVSYYRFLQCVGTFEHQILQNLEDKAARMASVIDQDFPLATCDLSELEIGLDVYGV